jgi:hypothetical protein
MLVAALGVAIAKWRTCSVAKWRTWIALALGVSADWLLHIP